MMEAFKKLKTKWGDLESNRAGMISDVTVDDKFPEEILEHVFANLDADVKTLVNVSNASDQFNRILDPTKPAWIFEEVFPMIFPTLDKADILNCRSVCKKWKNAVDDHLQYQPHTRLMEGYKAVKSTSNAAPGYAPQIQQNLVRKRLMCIVLHELDALNRFMEDFKYYSPSENPFVMRSVSFDGGANILAQQIPYWNRVFELLHYYGHHIWHLYYHIGPTDTHIPSIGIKCYNILHCLLSLMPNLKNMAITQFNHRPAFPISNVTAKLKRHIYEFPLPSLDNLESIEIELPTSEDNKQVNYELMRRYLPHTRTIILHLSMLEINNRRLELYTSHLTSLFVYVDESLSRWNYFCNRLQAPNLVKLSLAFHTNQEIRKILMPLSKFRALRYLRLRFSRRPTDLLFGPNDVTSFVLEQIKTLEIVDNLHVPYYLLFAHFPKLEYLLVCGEESQVWNTEQRHSYFKNWSFRESMAGSHIWTKLKELKELTMAWMGSGYFETHEIVANTKYTREMFETNSK